MKINSFFATLAVAGCTTTNKISSHLDVENKIEFENTYQFKAQLIDEPYKVVTTQAQMDEVYKKVHQHVKGNRFPPIPIIYNDTYLVIKATPSNLNDVIIDSVFYKDKVMTVFTKPFNNPDYKQDNKVVSNVILRFNQVLDIEKVKINY